MMIFIPMGVEDVTVRRVPWVSIGIAAVTVLMFLGTWYTRGDGVNSQQLGEVIEYWQKHPYTEISPEFQDRFLNDHAQAELGSTHRRAMDEGAPDAFEVARDQATLDGMTRPLVRAAERYDLKSLAMVPRRGPLQIQLFTSMFIHYGWLHLLGNLLFFYIAALILEDLWGRPLFLAFYLCGGVVAAFAQWALEPHATIAIGGASGAIAACMGAFALRLATTKIRIGYFIWIMRISRGTFVIPAWIAGGVWALSELKDFVLGGGTAGGVAVMAHLGGFAFGLAVAYAIKVSKLEERVLAPRLEAEHIAFQRDARLDVAEEALGRNDPAAARVALEQLLAEKPDAGEAMLLMARVVTAAGNPAAAQTWIQQGFQKLVGRNEPTAVWSAVEDLGPLVDPAKLTPALSFKIASEIEQGPEGVRPMSERFFARAGAQGGTLGAKAWLKAAEMRLAAFHSADVALEYLDHAEATGALGPELRPRHAAARERALTDPRVVQSSRQRESREVVVSATLEPEPPAPAPPEPVDLTPKIVDCRLSGMDSSGLTLEVPGQGPQRLSFGDLLAVSVATAGAPPAAPGGAPRTVLFTDFVLSWGSEERGLHVLRVPSNGLGLTRLYPAMTAAEAYAEFLKTVVDQSGATTLPERDALRSGRYPRFPDVAAMNEKLYGPVG